MANSTFNKTELLGRFGPAAAVAIGLATAPVSDHGQVVCPLRIHAGIACPSCGMTRAIGSVTRGDFAHSIEMNPIGIVMVAQALAIVGALASGRSSLMRRAWAVWLPAALSFDAVALIIIWVIRYSQGTLPY